MSNVNKNIIASAFSAGSRLLQKVIGLFSTLVLARLLSPDDFGVVAIVWVIILFVDSLVNSGARDYLIQKESIDDDDINSAWTLNLALKASVVSLLILCSPFIANWYNQPGLVGAIIALALVTLITTAGNPYMIVLHRERNYKPSFKIDIWTKVFGVIATIVSAFVFRSYWALIIGHLTTAIVKTSLTYARFPYRPRLTLVKVKEQFSFSQWVLLRNVFGYMRSQVDTFLVSIHFGLAALGGYHVNKYVSRLPALEGLSPLMSPLMASFSSVQSNVEDLSYQISFSLIVLLALATPLAAGMFFNAEPISLLLLGTQWVEYAGIFAVFSLSMFILPFYNFFVSVLYIKKRAKQVFYYDITTFIILSSALLYATKLDLLTFVIIKIGIDLFFVTCFGFYALQGLAIIRMAFKAFYCGLFIAAIFSGAYVIRLMIPESWNIIASLTAFGVVFAFHCFLVFMLFFKLFLSGTKVGHHIKYLEKQHLRGYKVFGLL